MVRKGSEGWLTESQHGDLEQLSRKGRAPSLWCITFSGQLAYRKANYPLHSTHPFIRGKKVE